MKIFRIAVAALAGALVFSSAEAKKKPPGLEPFAGSYTGSAQSTTNGTTLSGNATLTFTGRKSGLRGTFLYTGILNRGGVAQEVVQTFDLSHKGVVRGRVSLGGVLGAGSGNVRLVKKKNLSFALTYTLVEPTPLTLQLVGQVAFRGKRATLTATVTASDAAGSGALTVKGRR